MEQSGAAEWAGRAGEQRTPPPSPSFEIGAKVRAGCPAGDPPKGVNMGGVGVGFEEVGVAVIGEERPHPSTY